LGFNENEGPHVCSPTDFLPLSSSPLSPNCHSQEYLKVAIQAKLGAGVYPRLEEKGHKPSKRCIEAQNDPV
jgi:hypothetical protein